VNSTTVECCGVSSSWTLVRHYKPEGQLHFLIPSDFAKSVDKI